MNPIIFTCPVCGEKLVRSETGKSLLCNNGHCFDVARSGYVNLILANNKNSVNPGDNKEMAEARKRIMSKGYYNALADKIIEILKESFAETVLDAGCGTGFLAGEIVKRTEMYALGTDISKSAVETASKTYKDVNFAVASSKRMPFANESFDAVVCAFAPVYPNEFSRITKKGGLLIRVVPGVEHLYELKKILYDVPRKNLNDETRYDEYEFIKTVTVRNTFTGTEDDMAALVKMTPYYYHTPAENLERLKGIGEITVGTEFDVTVFRNF